MRHIAMLAALLAFETAARAETFVPPCLGTCTPPVADGAVDDLEYANGIGIPLSNFAAGGKNGSLRLLLIDETLYAGLRVPKPIDSNRGDVKIFLDADRPGTSCAPTQEKPASEDRLLTVVYDLAGAGSASIDQLIGNGTGWQSPSGPMGFLKVWPTTMKLGKPPTDPGMIHLEVAITLRPTGADDSAVLTDGMLGFALHHLASGANQHVPGGAGTTPGVASPCSWETLVFDEPDVTPLSISVWPSVIGGGGGEPEDVADVIWARDITCLPDLDEDDDQEDIIDAVNARRAADGRPDVTAVVWGWTWDDPVYDSDHPNLILSSLPVIASGNLDRQTLWARILTHASVPAGERGGYKAGEFVDVFCISHGLGEQGGATADWIDFVRASDRPAIVLGDMSSVESFDLGLTPFEEANEWLSDKHQLQGTPDYNDNSHFLLLPAKDAWPTFGIKKEPTAVEKHHHDEDGEQVGSVDKSALVKLVRTDEPGHWNPKKKHRVTYRVSRLVDHASGGCCADWFAEDMQFLGGQVVDFDDDATPDGDDVDPGWAISTDLIAGSITATVQVWDWDSGPNDHYDVIAEPGLEFDPFFRVTHASGLVERIGIFGQLFDVLGTFEQSPGGLAVKTKGDFGEIATAFHVITATEID
jgi:hypothetical protein